MGHKIILNPKGTGHKELDIDELHIPDLWHIGQWLIKHGHPKDGKAVLEVWATAQDLKYYIQSLPPLREVP